MDEAVADIIRRLTEWREDTRATFEKLAAQSTNAAQDLKPDEVTKSMRETLAFYGLGAKYHETMGRLSRFFNENSTEEKRANLPEVAWWQKLKKLFEIEESFHKEAKEAFAADNLGDYEIYSGLAKEALDQIRNSIEKADTPVPVAASIENNSEPGQEQTPSLKLLVKVCRFYLDYEVFIVLSMVSLFLGTQAPTQVGSGYPVVDGLVSALLYGFGLCLIYGFCKNAISVAIESALLLNWRKYLRVIVALAAIVYGFAFLEAKANPLTLWKRSWHQDHVEMKNIGRYRTSESCIAEQWKSLNQERTTINEVEKYTKDHFPDLKSVFILHGRTIFEFRKSFYSQFPEQRDKLAADTLKRTDLSDYQKRQLIAEALRPEIVSTISFFCASTSKNAVWPFHTPNYNAPGEALTDLGERILAGRAVKILGE